MFAPSVLVKSGHPFQVQIGWVRQTQSLSPGEAAPSHRSISIWNLARGMGRRFVRFGAGTQLFAPSVLVKSEFYTASLSENVSTGPCLLASGYPVYSAIRHAPVTRVFLHACPCDPRLSTRMPL